MKMNNFSFYVCVVIKRWNYF